MQRCTTCNRTYQDDTIRFCTLDGGRLTPVSVYDPAPHPQNPHAPAIAEAPPQVAQAAPLPRTNTDKTISSFTAPGIAFPTTDLQGQTGFTAPDTSPSVMPQTPPPPARKRSRLPLILGIVFILVVLLFGAGVALFFVLGGYDRFIAQSTNGPATTNTNSGGNSNSGGINSNSGNQAGSGINSNSGANTNSGLNGGVNTNENANSNAGANGPAIANTYTPPPGAVKFVNSRARIAEPKLAEHFVNFSFYYPATWKSNPKAGTAGSGNFADVLRAIPPDRTQEELTVGWYQSNGTFDADRPQFPGLAQSLSSKLAGEISGYQKISEGETTVNSLNGYEFRFQGNAGDVKVWGRAIFLPPGSPDQKNGVTLIMVTSSYAPELHSVQDVGVKGGLPVILDSFRFGAS